MVSHSCKGHVLGGFTLWPLEVTMSLSAQLSLGTFPEGLAESATVDLQLLNHKDYKE